MRARLNVASRRLDQHPAAGMSFTGLHHVRGMWSRFWAEFSLPMGVVVFA